jgi:hypothetical protein
LKNNPQRARTSAFLTLMATQHFEQLLSTATKSGAITQAGRDWLTLALDPEHHRNRCIQAGFPDGYPANNMIRTLNEQQTFTLPYGTDGTWKGIVFSIPEICTQTLGLASSQNHVLDGLYKYVVSDGITPVQWGLYNAVFVPGASSELLPSNFSADFTYPAGTLLYHSNHAAYCDGYARMVSGSFKVCNTSVVTSLGGSGTAFRVPTQLRDAAFTLATTSTAASAYPTTIRSAPPLTLEMAYLIPGSVAFDLKDGIYMPLTFREPPKLGVCRYITDVWAVDDIPNDLNQYFVRTEYTGAGAKSMGAVRTTPNPCARDSGTNICGVFLEGLTQGMSFNLMTKTQYEIFPSPKSTDITLARPPPKFDEISWELYRRIAQNLPAYATFDSNDSSSWWDVVCAAGVAAARVIPHPLFAAAVMPTLSVARQVFERRQPRSSPLNTFARDAAKKGGQGVIGTSKGGTGGKPTPSAVREQMLANTELTKKKVLAALHAGAKPPTYAEKSALAQIYRKRRTGRR